MKMMVEWSESVIHASALITLAMKDHDACRPSARLRPRRVSSSLRDRIGHHNDHRTNGPVRASTFQAQSVLGSR
jgi:hypothetical protein